MLKKKVIHTLVLLLAGTIIGFAALYLVFCLPTEKMQLHVWQSVPMLEEEFGAYELLYSYPATLSGNFTDCLMLENAIYHNEEHSRLRQMLYMYRGESSEGPGWASGYSLVDYLAGVAQPREVEYARYWHGYLVFLKPLLLITNLQTLRVAFAAVQLLLAGLVSLACGKRQESFLGVAFLVALPFLYFFSMYTSMSLSLCFYILAFALLVQLRFHHKLEKGWYGEYFLIVGMVTAYFDFLTYPLVTLGFPLCVYLYLHTESCLGQLKRLFSYSVEWGVGYIGLWSMKWALTDLLTGGDIIGVGLAAIQERTSAVEGFSKLSSFIAVLKLNFSVYFNWGFYLLVLGVLIWLGCKLFCGRKSLCKEAFLQGGIIWLVAFFPIIWFALSQNHSQQHWVFTCKILAVSFFAFICGIGKVVREGKQGEVRGD